MTLTRTLTAFNTATASENKIHADDVASRFGFTGGLVPGVDVFAYMAHPPVEAWGRDWLSQGRIRAKFDALLQPRHGARRPSGRCKSMLGCQRRLKTDPLGMRTISWTL